jgi:adenylate cyclase
MMISLKRNDISTWQEAYQDMLIALTCRRFRVTSLLVVLIVFLDALVQYFIQPDLFYGLFWTRLVTITAMLLLFLLIHFEHFSRLAIYFSFLGILVVAADIEAAIIATGGYQSPFQAGLVLLVVAVGLLFPYSFSQMMIAAFTVWLVYLLPLDDRNISISRSEDAFLLQAFFLFCATLLALTASFMTSRLRKHEFIGRLALQAEQEKSERLLLNVLPEPIAARLKNGEKHISDNYDSVTVMFTDIVGFTPLAEQLQSNQLVTLLNDVFSRFDQLAKKYGVEKIKTIGDAYMVVGGVPIVDTGHATAIAEMALEMLQSVEDYNQQQGSALTIRIGINSGPVVAGVIGRQKFSYDLWGDTVNTASRMESHGAPGCIHVTESTYRQLRNSYEFDRCEPVEIKGKGLMQTYFLQGKIEDES